LERAEKGAAESTNLPDGFNMGQRDVGRSRWLY